MRCLFQIIIFALVLTSCSTNATSHNSNSETKSNTEQVDNNTIDTLNNIIINTLNNKKYKKILVYCSDNDATENCTIYIEVIKPVLFITLPFDFRSYQDDQKKYYDYRSDKLLYKRNYFYDNYELKSLFYQKWHEKQSLGSYISVDP